MEYLTPEDMIAGGDAVFDISIPSNILHPDKKENNEDKEMLIKLRPLTIGSFALIMKAGNGDPSLIPLLMIKASIQEPALSLDQIKKFHLGLVNFLISRIRGISGFDGKKNSLAN